MNNKIQEVKVIFGGFFGCEIQNKDNITCEQLLKIKETVQYEIDKRKKTLHGGR